MSALPKGWTLASVGQIIVEMQYGSSAKTNADPSGVPVLRMGNIQDGKLDLSSLKYLPQDHAEFPDLLLNPGDLLFNRTNSPELVGKSAVYRGSPVKCSCASYLIRVVLHPDCEPNYLAYYLNSMHGKQWVATVVVQQVGQANVNGAKLKALELPLPPAAEQRRIVGKVEELFSELDEGVANLKQARAQLAVYRQALLKHAFEGHLTADWRSNHRPVATVQSTVPHPIESWRFTTLADLTEYITSGSRGWAEFYADAGPIFIRAANLNRDRLDLSDVAFVTLPKGVEGTRTRTRLGDVFVTITGANVTKAGFLDHEIGEAYVSQHVALCRPTDPTISEYLHLYIISNAGGRRDLEKAAYGAGKPGLNLDNLRMLQIPMPTRAEIPLIVEAIRSQLSAVCALETDIDLNLQKAEALRQSILKKAFAGELVSQDPADEPAAALLDRIRAEREAQPVNRKTRR
jgi:type I restriction enzyme S subunit